MATQKQTFEQFFNPESFRSFMNTPGLNSDEMMKTYRRNMEAITNAGQAATEAARNIAQVQTNIARETMDDMTQFWRNWIGAGTNMQERMEVQNLAAREGWNKAVAHSQELSNIVQKSQERFMKTMNEG